ncbi:hypothetical protein UFOVP643_7 [uncultured Caudovirales phage]|uniref:Uncharacterized protein n=1 Tax=uncultured Caudovirales phage TaxID=2100421 RepID=A0A6J5N7S4_9CAUD|nr:hypothetical protein UFOVP282_28 [uncultured Caudovirales phage]CAB4154502.1 hypothetical protein UFOVP643_7 [uncultured Caudovirales phage]
MKLYTIYYGTKPSGIPKIGCDEAYPNRPLQQNMVNYSILEQHEDIMIASKREIELQKQYGVRVDRIPYYMTKINAAKASHKAQENGTHNFQTMSTEQRTAIAKATTPWKNSEFQSEMAKRNRGVPKPHSKELAKALNMEWTCESCGKTGKGRGNYTRWHKNNKCINV